MWSAHSGWSNSASCKLRLILDLRYVNSFLSKTSFRYEDIKTAAALFNKGDYFFVFDLRSDYHHIDIAPSYEQYLGFEWRNLTRDGAYERQVYLFCSLPFGLATAPLCYYEGHESADTLLEKLRSTHIHVLGRWRWGRIRPTTSPAHERKSSESSKSSRL